MKKVKKNTSQSQASLRSVRSTKSDIQYNDDADFPNLDVMTIKIKGLQSDDQRPHLIKVAFFDQLVLSDVIRPRGTKESIGDINGPKGSMNYDPSDYEKMCLFADNPMIVQVQPLKEEESDHSLMTVQSINVKHSSTIKSLSDISCCYVDILPIFIDVDKLCVRKRLQPFYEPTVLSRKSWDNLPLLTMEISVLRHPENQAHHKLMREANYMKLTLVGAYNMMWPYDDEQIYTAATRTPLYNAEKLGLVTFNQGTKIPKHFIANSFFPQWESLRSSEGVFVGGDEKFVCDLEDIKNEDDIALDYFMNKDTENSIIWGSFHRTLLLGDLSWFSKHIRRYKWPLEFHVFGETAGMSMMTALDLFCFLSSGVDTVRLAVPLKWMNASWLMDQCGSEPLLSAVQTTPSLAASRSKKSITKGDPVPIKISTEQLSPYGTTGSNNTDAFIVVEVKLGRPLRKPCIPPQVPDYEIHDMLSNMEQPVVKRECTARGQLDRDWQSTVRMAVNALKKVPYFGMTDLCSFNRQLSETRTRVEIYTSFWQDAAVYVNNKFVVSDFLGSDNIYEEMLMMSHACLMKTLFKSLVNMEEDSVNPVLRAARHDTLPKEPTLISMACTAFEEEPESAEPFFVALLALYPLWTTGWVIANAYYIERQMFLMADEILDKLRKVKSEGLAEDMTFPRLWDHELGDWWDSTPLLPGMSRYLDAADILLRLRAMTLAEVCLARALSETGESAAYYHLVALNCRLRGDTEDALCHVRVGIQKFGELSYLRSLEAECLHKENNCTDAKTSYGKAIHCTGPYSILLSLPSREVQRMRPILVDLVRRQPSAYAWIALAENWLRRNLTNDMATVTDDKTPPAKCAAACAVQALKWDRRAGKAWALLATLVKPAARAQHCRNMAIACGLKEKQQESIVTEDSVCWRQGRALRECRCDLCDHIPRVTCHIK